MSNDERPIFNTESVTVHEVDDLVTLRLPRSACSPTSFTSQHSSASNADTVEEQYRVSVENAAVNTSFQFQNSHEQGDSPLQDIGQAVHSMAGILKDVVKELHTLKEGHSRERSVHQPNSPAAQTQRQPHAEYERQPVSYGNYGRGHGYTVADEHAYYNMSQGNNRQVPTDEATRYKPFRQYQGQAVGHPQYSISTLNSPTYEPSFRPFICSRTDVKIPSFTGKEDWSVWHSRFEAIATRYGWSTEDRLDQLLPRLEGQAAQFVFAQLRPAVLHNYDTLVSEMNSRYRVIETSRAFAAKFSRRMQKPGETAEEFAADLKRLYDKAHGFRDQRTRDEDLTRRFLDGLYDDEVRFEVEYHKEPNNIDEAVFHVVNFIQTIDTGKGNHEKRNRKGTRRADADCDDSSDEENHTLDCRQARKDREQFRQNNEALMQRGNNNRKTADVKDNQASILQQLLERLEKLEEAQTQSPHNNTRINKTKGQKQNTECFNCHEIGHFASECPKPKEFRVYRQESINGPGGAQKTEEETCPLNFRGPTLVARGRSN